jgi:hypothetical protein
MQVRFPFATRGVDVDSVVPDIRMRHRRVTVHDESFVISRVDSRNSFRNPDQIVNVLLLDGDVRANAGMHEQEIAATELIAQTLHEQFVFTWKRVKKAALQIEGRVSVACSSMP